jgi:hypothetical protein
MYKKKKYKEEKVDSRNKKKGRAHLCTEREKKFPSPSPTSKNASAGVNAKSKKQVSTRRSPLFESHRFGALSVRPYVCVYVCVRFHSVNSSISPSRGYHREQEKKVVAVSKEASRYTVLAPALETAPWIWVSDSQSATAQIERSAIVCVICHRYPAAIGIGVCKQCAWVQALIVNKRLAMTS